MEENRLKHRLVGATVLVALGVVLLPVWLDMRPGPGTRLEKTNIPAKPQWHFFSSQKEEHPLPPPQPIPNPSALVEDHATSGAPASVSQTAASTPPNPALSLASPPPTLPATTQNPAPVPVPTPPAAHTGVYNGKVGAGASLYAEFAKANLGADQVRAVLRLGEPTKTLEHIQKGLSLWIKSNAQKTLEELIYYGPEHKVYLHVIRHGNRLQLATSASAATALGTQASAQPQQPTKIAPPTPLVAKSMLPAAKPVPPTPLVLKPVPPTPLALKPVSAATQPARASAATAWVIQIVSLNREESARALQDSLRSKGFPVFLESLYDGTNKRWRVRVGPSTDHAEVDALRGRLEREAHLMGQVLPYP